MLCDRGAGPPSRAVNYLCFACSGRRVMRWCIRSLLAPSAQRRSAEVSGADRAQCTVFEGAGRVHVAQFAGSLPPGQEQA